MIFMSQSGLTDPAREADWDRWYLGHLRLMVSVDGIASAQRFKTDTPDHPPSAAMYSVRSPAVFEDPCYLSVRGLGEFLPLVDRRYYRRNLFDGLEYAPAVGGDEILLVWDAPEPQPSAGIEYTWLQAVAIDRSTPWRGIAVVSASHPLLAAQPGTIARYIPATQVLH